MLTVPREKATFCLGIMSIDVGLGVFWWACSRWILSNTVFSRLSNTLLQWPQVCHALEHMLMMRLKFTRNFTSDSMFTSCA